VIVSESFDASTAALVHRAVREEAAGTRAQIFPQGEIGLRLYAMPAFREFVERLGVEIEQAMILTPAR
jgi:hypothetical protein